jgi:hypothetical protein
MHFSIFLSYITCQQNPWKIYTSTYWVYCLHASISEIQLHPHQLLAKNQHCMTKEKRKGILRLGLWRRQEENAWFHCVARYLFFWFPHKILGHVWPLQCSSSNPFASWSHGLSQTPLLYTATTGICVAHDQVPPSAARLDNPSIVYSSKEPSSSPFGLTDRSY